MIDLSKNYQTGNGEEVRFAFPDDGVIYGFFRKPVDHVLKWLPCQWFQENGLCTFSTTDNLDLEPAPDKKHVNGFLHIFDNNKAPHFSSVRMSNFENIFAIIEVDQLVKEGEGITISQKQKDAEIADILRKTNEYKPDPFDQEPLVKVKPEVRTRRKAELAAKNKPDTTNPF